MWSPSTNCRPQMLQRGLIISRTGFACKGGAPGVIDFAVATKYIEWLALGTIALGVPGKLFWNGNRRRFTNSDPLIVC